MNEEKVRILEASYNIDNSLAKITVANMETGEEKTWALLGNDFDSLIAQITGKPLTYHDEQRLLLCEKIVGIEFLNRIEVDIENPDIDKAKDKNLMELQHGHDVVDRYPFFEIQQEAIENSLKDSVEK